MCTDHVSALVSLVLAGEDLVVACATTGASVSEAVRALEVIQLDAEATSAMTAESLGRFRAAADAFLASKGSF